MIKFPMKDAPRDGRGLELLVKYDREEDGNPLVEEKYAWTIGCNTFQKSGVDEWLFVGWDWDARNFTQGKGTPIAWRHCGLNEVVDTSKLEDFTLTDVTIDELIKHIILPSFKKDAQDWFNAWSQANLHNKISEATECFNTHLQFSKAVTVIEDLVNLVAKLESKLNEAGINVEG